MRKLNLKEVKYLLTLVVKLLSHCIRSTLLISALWRWVWKSADYILITTGFLLHSDRRGQEETARWTEGRSASLFLCACYSCHHHLNNGTSPTVAAVASRLQFPFLVQNKHHWNPSWSQQPHAHTLSLEVWVPVPQDHSFDGLSYENASLSLMFPDVRVIASSCSYFSGSPKRGFFFVYSFYLIIYFYQFGLSCTCITNSLFNYLISNI